MFKNPWKKISKISPKRQKGTRQISNDVFHALMSADLNGIEFRVVFAIIDKTWGFNKKNDTIAVSQISAMTGIVKRSIYRALSSLKVKRIIYYEQSGKIFSSDKNDTRVVTKMTPNIFIFNKYFDTWDLQKKKPKKRKKRVVTKMTQGSDKNDTRVVTKVSPTKESISKETYTKEKILPTKSVNLTPTDKDIQDAKTNQAKLALYFAKKYGENTGFPYDLKKKDFIICEKLLQKYDKNMIFAKIGILEVYCSGKVEVWFANGGWGDFTIGKLSSSWNNLLPRLTLDQKKEIEDKKVLNKYEQHERRINELLTKKSN